MGKNKGSKGAELGKKLLKECVKKTLNGEIISEPKYTATEFYTLSIEPNYIVWVNYHTIFTEYITRYNDYVAAFSEFERAYFHILLIVSKHYLDNCKHGGWKDEEYEGIAEPLLSDTAKCFDKVFKEALKALKTTLANIEYIRLYSLAFIGDESLSVPAEKFSCVVDIHKRLTDIKELFTPDIYPERLPVIPKENSEKILKALKNIDLTQRLAPGILISYTPHLLWKEDKL